MLIFVKILNCRSRLILFDIVGVDNSTGIKRKIFSSFKILVKLSKNCCETKLRVFIHWLKPQTKTITAKPRYTLLKTKKHYPLSY